MPDLFKLSSDMFTTEVQQRVAPASSPASVVRRPAVGLSPPVYAQQSSPPYALIAAGVVAAGVVGLIVYKKKFAKKRR